MEDDLFLDPEGSYATIHRNFNGSILGSWAGTTPPCSAPSDDPRLKVGRACRNQRRHADDSAAAASQ